VRLIERRSAALKPFEAVSAEIRKGLIEEQRKRLQEEFTHRMISQAQPELFPATLAALTNLPNRAGAASPQPAAAPGPAPSKPSED
jgi:hypothetical protein